MKPLRPLLLILSAAMLAFQSAPTYDLIWKPKQDDVLDYTLVLELSVEQYKFLINTDVRMKVLKVEANGDYELETAASNVKVRFQDDEEMTQKDPEPTVERFSARGVKISTPPPPKDGDEDADPVGQLLEQVSDFSVPDKPVAQGGKWSKEIESDPKSKRIAARLDYEVVGLEGEGDDQLVKVDYKYQQKEGSEPVSATGTYRLKLSDFSLSSFEALVKNFQMDEEAPLGEAKLLLKRKS